jgi:hypothetical protein
MDDLQASSAKVYVWHAAGLDCNHTRHIYVFYLSVSEGMVVHQAKRFSVSIHFGKA